MSVLIGGQSGNQSRIGTGLAASGPEFQPEVAQTPIVSPQSRLTGKFRRAIYGITKDSTGAALGACAVHAFRTTGDVQVDNQTSDASGNYEVSVYDDGPFYVVAYKAGAPDVTGATVNTLAGV